MGIFDDLVGRAEWWASSWNLELEVEFYLFDRQLHNIGEIKSTCKIILSGDSHKGTNWPLT